MRLLHEFDYKLAKLVQILPKNYQPLMRGVTFWGEPLIVLGIGLGSFIIANNRGERDIEKALILCALAYGLNTILKQLLHRRRPHNLRLTTLGIKSYSFPSGHAFGTVIFYGLLAYLGYVRLAEPGAAIVGSLLILAIFLIGVSRIYLKTHYPSDVIAGWMIGAASLYIIIKLSF